MTQKIVPEQVVHHEPIPSGDQKIHCIPIKCPHGLCRSHFLRLPNKGRCCPKRKKNHPLPRNNVGSGDPIPLTPPLPCGAKGVHGELGFGVLIEDSAGVVGKGLGKPTIRLPRPSRGLILTFWTLIMRGWWGLSFPLPTATYLLPFLLHARPPLRAAPHRGSSLSLHPSRHGP